MIKRGDIYWVKDTGTTGCEYAGDRPCVVVSNDIANKYSSILQVVPLTTKRHSQHIPTKVPIYSSGVLATACCEQIKAVDIHRIGSYVGHCSPLEMKELDGGIMVSLGLKGVHLWQA